MTQDVVYPEECSMCTWEEAVFCTWMEMYWRYQWDPSKTRVSLLIFCFDNLSIGVSWVLKFPTIIVLLLVFVLCIEVLLYVGCIDIYNCYVFLLDWSLDHYVVSFLISCNLYLKVYFVWYEDCYSSFLLLPIAWNIFFHPLTLSLYVFLGLKWVSCRQYVYVSCFCIHSASLCPLVGAFNLFKFKVIIDIYMSYWHILNCLGLIFIDLFFFSYSSWLYKSLLYKL